MFPITTFYHTAVTIKLRQPSTTTTMAFDGLMFGTECVVDDDDTHSMRNFFRWILLIHRFPRTPTRAHSAQSGMASRTAACENIPNKLLAYFSDAGRKKRRRSKGLENFSPVSTQMRGMLHRTPPHTRHIGWLGMWWIFNPFFFFDVCSASCFSSSSSPFPPFPSSSSSLSTGNKCPDDGASEGVCANGRK